MVWLFCVKRYFFALELQDGKANQAIAELKAKQIQRDITNELFDPTLEKYRAATNGERQDCLLWRCLRNTLLQG